MKDLDFDELDKAISNVLTTEEIQPDVSPAPTTPVSVQSDASQPAAPNVVRVTNPVQTPFQSPSLVRPRTSVDRPSFTASSTGRPTAMDIVAPPSQGASRSGTTLQPGLRMTEPVVQPEEKLLEAHYDDAPQESQQQDTLDQVDQGWPSITPKTPVQPTTMFGNGVEDVKVPANEENIQETPSSVTLEPSSTSDQASDHMFGSFGEVIETNTVSPHETSIAPEESDIEVVESATIDKNPTPFLSGTKVEKRPLGNFATSSTVTTESQLAAPKIEEIPATQDQDHDSMHNKHVVGGSEAKKGGKGLFIGAIVFLIVVICGVLSMFIFGDQLGL